MSSERVRAKYLIETMQPVEQAAEVLAGEQSSGTFVAVPGETEELKERFRARLENLTPLEAFAEPSLPGAHAGASYNRAEIEISFSLENMGTNLPTLVSTVAGNLFELRELSGLKLLDIELPDAFSKAFPGPQFGIEGTRELAGVHGRPIIGTIVKPSVGLSPAQTADLAAELAAADIDFIKDDELMGDPPYSPLKERVEVVMHALNKHAEKTGKKVMYAFNISDSFEKMMEHHDVVKAAGGTCVMVSLNSVGLVGVEALRRRCELPIHGHRNGWGMLTRHPSLGIEFEAYQKLWRLAGVDHLHVNGIRNKFWEPDDSVVRSIRACLAPMLGGFHIMPVISSGQWGGQAPDTYAQTQTVDLMYLAGGGMISHPGGPGSGCRAIRQAWEAAVAGVTLEEYAKEHTELAQSLEKFS
ncbi:MAG: ribulose-bisphosphate carboxylase large subunit family protein [Candidatus Latescibacterota bacterium]|jgi:ribulose-bisphosphate carboxylase large chain